MADNLFGTINIFTQPGRTKTGPAVFSSLPEFEENNSLISVNTPIPIQVGWAGGSTDMNNLEPNRVGDVVNIILEVWMGNLHDINNQFSTGSMVQIATLSKSRDLPMIFGDVPPANVTSQTRHWFTFDIQPICADLLSYTLCPAGKGTLASAQYGGLNGGYIGNVVSGFTNPVQSSLGAFRWIDFRITAQVLGATTAAPNEGDVGGELVDWQTVGGPNDGNKKYANNNLNFPIINNVPQWTDSHFNGRYIMNGGKLEFDITDKEFFTNCPNFDRTGTHTFAHRKKVKLTDDSEFLHFYIDEGLVSAAGDADTEDMAIKVTSDDGSYAYLRDFNFLLGYTPSVAQPASVEWRKYCIQNVSPVRIIEVRPAFTFGAGTFRAVLVMKRVGGDYQEISETRFYGLDTEDESPYEDVRFHWVNRAGGIDSYTAKRDVVEGISVSKSTIEKKVGQRIFHLEDPILSGDSNGSGTYQPSRDVFNVNASRTNSVYTEPLNKDVAGWLEELITSPNVWVQLENDASRFANEILPQKNPSTSNYFPVIITNNSIDTVDEDKGLVKLNIEYTHSHKINTQRN